MNQLDAISNQQVIIASFAVICAPLLSFLLSLIVKKGAAIISIVSIAISLIASVILFIGVWDKETLQFAIPWISFSEFNINIGFLLNNLTVIMLVLVSFIALLVNIYSVEYMRKDLLKPRYFAYLSLFCFAMLSLILANNLFLVYIFWELVGFSSYLLIGFWYTREKAALASKKAFIMNRLGDLGFLAGIMILLTHFKTLDIDAIFGRGNLIASSFVQSGLWASPFNTMPDYWLTIAGLCFFMGAIAKSAQFPFHTWLPDAMEGPTAVSSLIHAATMVAAGIFLLVRIEPLFNETVLLVIATIGLFTAFMAATIAVTQNDIKRVLAFSTVSQLGFMMLAIGIGDSAAAIFHLVTHAFFKCLLFLGAGILIHEMHHLKEKYNLDFDEQDMRFMGGLKKMMPITALVFIIASMALAGLPLTSGYLSKDAILIGVFEWADFKGGFTWIFPVLVSITSWLTTFYIFRVVFKVFFGEFRLPSLLNLKIGDTPLHEPNNWMKIPVLLLAVFCFGVVYAINPISLESSWLYTSFKTTSSSHSIYHTLVPIYISVLSLGLLYVAYLVYSKKSIQFNFENKWFYKFSYNQWYFNQVYNVIFIVPITLTTKALYWVDFYVIDGIVNTSAKVVVKLSAVANWLDKNIVDGLVSFSAVIVDRLGIWFRAVQNGKLQHYIIWMLVVFLSFFIFQMIY